MVESFKNRIKNTGDFEFVRCHVLMDVEPAMKKNFVLILL